MDLAKIDVEGFEPQVLKGMRTTLQRFRPALFIECLPDGPYREVEEILKNLGYQSYLLSREGPIQVERVTPSRMYHENFLFVHPERSIKV